MRADEHILLVEDEPDAVMLMRSAFKKAGVSNPLHVVSDGEQAISWLRGDNEHGDRARYPLPGLMILDLKLPRKSGFDVLAWLTSQPALSQIPAIVLTSSSERRDIDQAYASGANSYLVKPTSFLALVELATALKDFWVRHNIAPLVVVPTPLGSGAKPAGASG